MATGGAKIWYLPDGYLTEKNDEGSLKSLEALMLLRLTWPITERWAFVNSK